MQIEKSNQLESLKNFLTELKNYNLKIIKIKPDGNCLFRAISHQLFSTEENHLEIREKCIEYINREKIFYSKFINENFEKYIERKKKEGCWGDNIEIQAISEIYNLQIQIFHNEKIPIMIYNQEKKYEKIIRLFFRNLDHYDSIIEIKNIQNDKKYLLLKDLIKNEEKKMEKRNQIINRKNFKDFANMTLRQIIERSLKSLKKDCERHIKTSLKESNQEDIENKILQMVIKESQKNKNKITLYEKIINLGFPMEIAIQATLAFNNNDDADVEKVLSYIYSNLV